MGLRKIPEIPINSLHDYLKCIEDVESEFGYECRDAAGGFWTTYRGHGDKRYLLVPSLFRKIDTTPAFYVREQLLIQEALRLMPEEFVGLTAFQKLAKLQHFNLPTRLLDVTTNPLVALFFASGGPDNRDGEVIVVPRMPLFSEYSEAVNWISEWAINGDWNIRTGAAIANAAGFIPADSPSPDPFEPLIDALTSPFLAVRPSYTNVRLRAQSGAFLLTGMKMLAWQNEKSGDQGFAEQNFLFKPWLHDPIADSPFPVPQERYHSRFVVPAESKTAIRRQLDRVDINEATLFPDPEHRARYIADGFLNGTFGAATVPDIHLEWSSAEADAPD